jgi:hypothetical protein
MFLAVSFAMSENDIIIVKDRKRRRSCPDKLKQFL